MKISESNFEYFIMFINEQSEVVHSIGYEWLPNVASILENIDELKNDEEFKLDNVDSLYVDIINKENYISILGDLEV